MCSLCNGFQSDTWKRTTIIYIMEMTCVCVCVCGRARRRKSESVMRAPPIPCQRLTACAQTVVSQTLRSDDVSRAQRGRGTLSWHYPNDIILLSCLLCATRM